MSVYAVVVAAGMGTRLGAPVPKAWVELAGEPLIAHTARALNAAHVFDGVVMVVPRGYEEECRRLVGDLLSCPLRAVPGGPTRQASVMNGLEEVRRIHHERAADKQENPRCANTHCEQSEQNKHSKENKNSEPIVLVHDCARALTPPSVFQRVAAAVQEGYPCVVPALPVVDTIKRIGEKEMTPTGERVEFVDETVDRSSLRAMQTPQGAPLDTLYAAHQKIARLSAEEGTAAPDDAYVMEQSGYRVALVEGSEWAMKITRPLDLRIAEALLAE